MKKDRNTFFQSAGMSTQSYMPNMMNNNVPQNPYFYNQQPTPIQASQASQSFYSGPNIPMMNPHTMPNYDELENTIAKIERQINRLDSRLTKLENSLNLNLNDNDYSSKMYMV